MTNLKDRLVGLLIGVIFGIQLSGFVAFVAQLFIPNRKEHDDQKT